MVKTFKPERVQHGDLLTPEQAYIYGHWESKNKSIQLTNGTDTLFPLINPLKENHNV
ncbi:hypothetical protein P694_28 [Escherichia phage P694]|uniref:Uncharacterized protein n=1 Tax=Escherichia phage P694 TaxID=1572754 RepID=A0A0D3QHF2_9CAUD|nr:hypothetical protein P694_28 [Escherichia phage P694]AJF40508.1 hypothetical protein P694_28 [Escherichia phage P694]